MNECSVLNTLEYIDLIYYIGINVSVCFKSEDTFTLNHLEMFYPKRLTNKENHESNQINNRATICMCT